MVQSSHKGPAREQLQLRLVEHQLQNSKEAMLQAPWRRHDQNWVNVAVTCYPTEKQAHKNITVYPYPPYSLDLAL
ncbi:hypothetical protein GW7_18069 [Heterocephalus glaber]|uniref:Uncharacterized protein n=1 Tax=Heterocephalus glaber TaxID=10181 RepID=G5C9M8_HETGA|nr:hypothetical protein GW7_18069 [Heterocephalus glaber]